jgi:phosphatidylethanolamine/phosphatidyl-N-methylethanolamine N-methyltransferase
MFDFFKQYIANPQKTGALAPSSTELAGIITQAADIPKARTVVEFGSGTGVFTEKIMQQLTTGTVFFALELNPFFVQETKRRCPAAVVYQDSAARVGQYLKKHKADKCDCIICGLPWASFTRVLQEELLQIILEVLNPGGEFLTFAYLHGLFLPAGQRYRKMLRQGFVQVNQTRVVWRNLPPAFVYHCRK